MNPPPSRATPRTTPSEAVAALHETAGSWKVVVLRAGDRPALAEAATLRTGASDELDALLRRHHATRLVRVAPARATVCRCVTVPVAAPGDMAAALALLAEVQLPEGVPAHRRAGGVIPDATRNGLATGMVTAWRDVTEPEDASRVADESWTTEPAALAFLRAPGGVAGYADPASGAIAVVAGGPDRTVARTMVEESASVETWERSVRAALEETATAVAASAPEWPGRSPLALDESSRRAVEQRVSGVTTAGRWLDDYGLALGAALVAAGNEAASPLARLHAQPPASRRSAPERVLLWAAAPRNAWSLMAAAVVVALLGPLALSWARLAALENDARDLPALESRAQELLRTAALYEQLASQRWPMTKLLADVAGATPVGVVVGVLRLSPEQGLSIEGVAQDTETLNKLQENLNRTGLFRSVRQDRSESSSTGVTFTVTAQVGSPYTAAARIEDFQARSLAERLYGEGASNTAWSPSVADRPARDRRASSDSPSRRGGENEADSGSAPARAPERPTGASSLPKELPAELTESALAGLTKVDATRAWIARRNYINTTPNLDAATKSRLEEEIEKLKAHNPAGAGGGGGP